MLPGGKKGSAWKMSAKRFEVNSRRFGGGDDEYSHLWSEM